MHKHIYKALSFLWLCVIFYLCFSKGSTLPKVKIEGMDKVAHFLLYFILNLFVCVSLLIEMKYTKTKGIIISVVFCSLVGIFVEWVQGQFIEGRSADINDVLFNSFGIIISVLFILKSRILNIVNLNKTQK